MVENKDAMVITPLEDIVTLTDGINTWNIKAEDFKNAVEYKLCQACARFCDNNCPYCVSEETIGYETAEIVNSEQIIIPIPHSENIEENLDQTAM